MAVEGGVAPGADRLAGAQVPITTRKAWFVLGILLLFNVLGYIDRSILALMVQPVKTDLGMTDVQIGLVHGLAFAFFYAICGLPIGWALDRFPKRPIVFAGILVWSLASAACGLAQNFEHLLIARFFVGMGEATLVPASYAILAGIFPRERLGRALSIFSLGTAIGMAVAMLAGGALIQMADARAAAGDIGLESWRLVFIATGLPGVLIAGLIFLVPEIRTTNRSKTGAIDDGFWHFVRTRKGFLISHYLGIGIMCLTAVAISAWLPTYMIRTHGWTAPQAAGAIAAATVFSVIAMLSGGYIVDAWMRRGRTNAHMLLEAIITPIAMLLAAMGFLLGSANAQFIVIGIGLSMMSMTGVGASALQVVTPPAYRARISAGYLLLYSMLGNGLGPLVPAFFTDYLYQDETRLGTSMLTSILVFGPVACILFLFGVRYQREAMAKLEMEGRA